jgi:hypothetical protein
MLWSFLILQQIGGEEDDGLVAEIPPPMGDLRGLGHHVACLVHDRRCAVARIFVDLAFDDVNDRRPIGVAMPGHDAVRLDGQLAHAEQASVDIEWRLRDID